MRWINTRDALLMARQGWGWDVVAEFATLPEAEAWLDTPPELLGDAGTVTIFADESNGYVVCSLRELRIA